MHVLTFSYIFVGGIVDFHISHDLFDYLLFILHFHEEDYVCFMLQLLLLVYLLFFSFLLNFYFFYSKNNNRKKIRRYWNSIRRSCPKPCTMNGYRRSTRQNSRTFTPKPIISHVRHMSFMLVPTHMPSTAAHA